MGWLVKPVLWTLLVLAQAVWIQLVEYGDNAVLTWWYALFSPYAATDDIETFSDCVLFASVHHHSLFFLCRACAGVRLRADLLLVLHA